MESKSLAWTDCSMLATGLLDRVPQDSALWGIPRGGCHVASILLGMLAVAPRRVVIVEHPVNATLAVDDIIDSGRTARRVKQVHGLDTVALIDKREHPDLDWVVFPWEAGGFEADAEALIERQLQMMGEDPNREGLRETPARVVRSWPELYEGYAYSVDRLRAVLKGFEYPYEQTTPVVIRNIRFYSMCEHHMMPFTGVAEVKYWPEGKIIGLSKIPRLVNLLARRLQVQERLTHQIAQVVASKSDGCVVTIRGRHSCLEHRGHKGEGIEMETTAKYEGDGRPGSL